MGDSEADPVLFGNISSVGIDSKSRAYVVDWHRSGVYVISGDGALYPEIGREGRENS